MAGALLEGEGTPGKDSWGRQLSEYFCKYNLSEVGKVSSIEGYLRNQSGYCNDTVGGGRWRRCRERGGEAPAASSLGGGEMRERPGSREWDGCRPTLQ